MGAVPAGPRPRAAGRPCGAPLWGSRPDTSRLIHLLPSSRLYSSRPRAAPPLPGLRAASTWGPGARSETRPPRDVDTEPGAQDRAALPGPRTEPRRAGRPRVCPLASPCLPGRSTWRGNPAPPEGTRPYRAIYVTGGHAPRALGREVPPLPGGRRLRAQRGRSDLQPGPAVAGAAPAAAAAARGQPLRPARPRPAPLPPPRHQPGPRARPPAPAQPAARPRGRGAAPAAAGEEQAGGRQVPQPAQGAHGGAAAGDGTAGGGARGADADRGGAAPGQGAAGAGAGGSRAGLHGARPARPRPGAQAPPPAAGPAPRSAGARSAAHAHAHGHALADTLHAQPRLQLPRPRGGGARRGPRPRALWLRPPPREQQQQQRPIVQFPQLPHTPGPLRPRPVRAWPRPYRI